LTGITAGLIGALVSMTFSFPMQLSLPPVIILVYLAILHNLAKAQRTLVLSKKKCLFITIGIGVYSLKVWSNQLGILQAEHFNTKSMRHALANNYKSAAETAFVAYKHQPLWHKSLYHVGTAFLRSSTPTYAIEPLRKYLNSYPYDVNGLSGLGAAFTENDQYTLAENYIRRSLEILPDNWPAYNHLGNLFLKQGKHTEAIAAFSKAVAGNTNNSKLWYNLAVAKAKEGQYHSAIEDFRKAERLEPGWQAPLEKIIALEKALSK
jgi:tetratricopeptide (TPR) repeat protein